MNGKIASREELEAELARAGLGDWSDKIAQHARWAAKFTTQSVTSDADIIIGASKLGGCPDLPGDMEWPHRPPYEHSTEAHPEAGNENSDFAQRVPLAFIAQFNLPEIAALGDLDFRLPKSGQLLIFYDVDTMPWGFDPHDRPGFRLVWFDVPTAALVRRETPEELMNSGKTEHRGAFTPVRLEPHRALSAPTSIAHQMEYLSVPDDLLEQYEEEVFAQLQAYPELDASAHQLCGWPDEIQDDMQVEAQLVSNGLYCGDGDAYDSEQGVALRSGAVDWMLLAQIDSDDDAGMMWGDEGCLYVWIHKDDLEARRFEKALLILQCS